jgi:hypothetical protein
MMMSNESTIRFAILNNVNFAVLYYGMQIFLIKNAYYAIWSTVARLAKFWIKAFYYTWHKIWQDWKYFNKTIILICFQPTRRERANKFLNIYKRNAKNLDALKVALEREHQTHLIDLLDLPSTSTITSMKCQSPLFDRFESFASTTEQGRCIESTACALWSGVSFAYPNIGTGRTF